MSACHRWNINNATQSNLKICASQWLGSLIIKIKHLWESINLRWPAGKSMAIESFSKTEVLLCQETLAREEAKVDEVLLLPVGTLVSPLWALSEETTLLVLHSSQWLLALSSTPGDITETWYSPRTDSRERSWTSGQSKSRFKTINDLHSTAWKTTFLF